MERKDLFEQWAPRYDETVSGGSFPFMGYETVLEKIVLKAAPLPGGRVLDVGTGTANLAQRFVEQKCAVWGIDFSEQMLVLARQKTAGVCLPPRRFKRRAPGRFTGRFFSGGFGLRSARICAGEKGGNPPSIGPPTGPRRVYGHRGYFFPDPRRTGGGAPALDGRLGRVGILLGSRRSGGSPVWNRLPTGV